MLSAKLHFIWKLVLFAYEWKLIFYSKNYARSLTFMMRFKTTWKRPIGLQTQAVMNKRFRNPQLSRRWGKGGHWRKKGGIVNVAEYKSFTSHSKPSTLSLEISSTSSWWSVMINHEGLPCCMNLKQNYRKNYHWTAMFWVSETSGAWTRLVLKPLWWKWSDSHGGIHGCSVLIFLNWRACWKPLKLKW